MQLRLRNAYQLLYQINTICSILIAVIAGISFVAPVNAFTPTLQVQRDIYLAQAIDNLPIYQFFKTGFAINTANPITIETEVPKEIESPVPTPITQAVIAEQRLNPSADNKIILEGEASFYSRAGCLGCNELRVMANGKPLDDNALTMAIGANLKHLVGYHAKVTNKATGSSVIVKITDTGGFYQARYGNRVADLTLATKQAIGMRGGVGQVRVEVF